MAATSFLWSPGRITGGAAGGSGPAEEVIARLEGLRRDGRLSRLRRVRLSCADGQKASTQAGQERSIITATAAGGPGGRVMNSFDRRNLGLLVEATPRVGAGGQVLLELQVQDTRPASEAAADANAPPGPMSLVHDTLKATLAVPAGRAVVASGYGEEGGPQRGRRFVVVVVRPAEAGR